MKRLGVLAAVMILAASLPAQGPDGVGWLVVEGGLLVQGSLRHSESTVSGSPAFTDTGRESGSAAGFEAVAAAADWISVVGTWNAGGDVMNSFTQVGPGGSGGILRQRVDRRWNDLTAGVRLHAGELLGPSYMPGLHTPLGPQGWPTFTAAFWRHDEAREQLQDATAPLTASGANPVPKRQWQGLRLGLDLPISRHIAVGVEQWLPLQDVAQTGGVVPADLRPHESVGGRLIFFIPVSGQGPESLDAYLPGQGPPGTLRVDIEYDRRRADPSVVSSLASVAARYAVNAYFLLGARWEDSYEGQQLPFSDRLQDHSVHLLLGVNWGAFEWAGSRKPVADVQPVNVKTEAPAKLPDDDLGKNPPEAP